MRIGALATIAVVAALPLAAARAEVVGQPGAPTPAFSARLSAGLAYVSQDLQNEREYRDAASRLLIVGRVSLLPLNWLEIIGTIAAADAHRRLTHFDSGIHVGGGGALRLYPLLQEKFGVNLGLGGGANFFRNRGSSPLPGVAGGQTSDQLDENQFHAELVLSRSFQIWNLYGGAIWQWSRYTESNPAATDPRTYGSVTKNDGLFPFGMFVGVDYFVTPLVFFTLEGQNFHTDAISAGIGMVLAP